MEVNQKTYKNLSLFLNSLKKQGIVVSFEEKLILSAEFGKAEVRKELPLTQSFAVSCLKKEHREKFKPTGL